MSDLTRRTPSGLYLPQTIQEQIAMIREDFRQTYFALVGSTVNSWYERNDGFDQFVRNSREDQARIQTLQRAATYELAGQVAGVGDVLALRLYENYDVNPARIRSDIESAVEDILSNRYSRLLNGVKRLGYWSGFSRAITY